METGVPSVHGLRTRASARAQQQQYDYWEKGCKTTAAAILGRREGTTGRGEGAWSYQQLSLDDQNHATWSRRGMHKATAGGRAAAAAGGGGSGRQPSRSMRLQQTTAMANGRGRSAAVIALQQWSYRRPGGGWCATGRRLSADGLRVRAVGEDVAGGGSTSRTMDGAATGGAEVESPTRIPLWPLPTANSCAASQRQLAAHTVQFAARVSWCRWAGCGQYGRGRVRACVSECVFFCRAGRRDNALCRGRSRGETWALKFGRVGAN